MSISKGTLAQAPQRQARANQAEFFSCTFAGFLVERRLFARSTEVPSTLEGPPYERNQKKVLVVGPGFGRELNPQQGWSEFEHVLSS